MKHLLSIWAVGLILCLGIFLIAVTPANSNEDRECIKYAPPTPTPIPPERIYSEWIPMPGSSAGMGKGWINVRDIGNYERTHNVLTDSEYNYIAKTYGMRQTRGSRYGETLWGYGFPPRIDFNTLYGGVILKNEWLPERLR